MSEVTEILDAVERGDRLAAEKLFPLAYQELRRLAASKMENERAGHTLQPTALVHEAYLRLVGPDGEERSFESRGHFFAAAATAMRRILIDNARRKQSKKRGGEFEQTSFDEGKLGFEVPSEEVLAVDEALGKLEGEHPELAEVVKLRYFAGMSIPEVAAVLGKSPSTVDRVWRAARAWLFREITGGDAEPA